MKKLNEKLGLLRMAEAFGITPDPKLVADIKRLQEQQDKIKARVHKASKELFEVSRISVPVSNPEVQIKPLKEEQHTIIKQEANAADSIEVQQFFDDGKQLAKQLDESVVDQVARTIKETVVSQGPPGLVPKATDPLALKVELLEKWISKIAALGPGSGEVNLRYLDDVNRSAIADGQYLRYDAPTKKFTFDAGFHNAYFLAAQSSQTQTSSATSANAMTFNITDSSFGISVDGGDSSQLIIANPGVYNLQFSSQFVNTGNAPDDVYIWLRQNGTDIPGSNGTLTVPAKDNNNSAGKVIAGWNYYVTTTSNNETVQLMWFVADETHIAMIYNSSVAATATSPAIPATASVIITISPVKVDSY